MTLPELNKKKIEAEKDLEITEQNCLEKNLQIPNLYQKWLSLFIRESYELKKLKLQLEKMYGTMFKELKENCDYKLNQGEIEKYINANEAYHKKCMDYELQNIICQFLENTVQNIKTISFNVKNFIDLKIFLSGGK